MELDIQMKTRSLPWPPWDEILNEFGNWLLVGSIASIGLPAAPGLISLFILIVYFYPKLKVPPEIDRYNILKKKAEAGTLSVDEQKLLSFYGAGELLSPPKRDVRQYIIGVGFWTMSIIYMCLKMDLSGHSLFF